mmetsp:Transcript_43686/g.103106  ORF Transcript_43686/g.103106 Transcript_43686/m.103106 type:complete len:302 (+) Transcript_43686:57-962(+)
MAAAAKDASSADSHRDAYAGRKSTSTRNPHVASKPASASWAKELMKLSPEERTLAMWRAAHGCPVSDEAKAQFTIEALGYTFRLADVRLWQDHHPKKSAKEGGHEKGAVFLEFFFDGLLEELGDSRDVFIKAFEDLIESQLRERRATEFKKRLTARRRPVKRGAASQADDADDCCIEGGGGMSSLGEEDDQEWKSYLQKKVPATDLSVRSMREAGCMLRFVVCQTSLSIGAGEELGQIAFPEHFPIDGKPQQIKESTKPLPRWVYVMGICTVVVVVVTLAAWLKVASELTAGTYGMQRKHP